MGRKRTFRARLERITSRTSASISCPRNKEALSRHPLFKRLKLRWTISERALPLQVAQGASLGHHIDWEGAMGIGYDSYQKTLKAQL
jgi:hypothetical protein